MINVTSLIKASLVIIMLTCLSSTSFSSEKLENIHKIITNPEPFYFLRHGQTEHNKEKRLTGHVDVPLNEVGRMQAEHAAKILKGCQIDVIVASPMKRTKETAEIVARKLNVPIIYNAGIQEVDWGSLEGQKVAESQDQIENWVNGKGPIDVENRKSFQLRITKAINGILENYKRPLIVSHAGVFGNFSEVVGLGFVHVKNANPYEFIPATADSKSLFTLKEIK